MSTIFILAGGIGIAVGAFAFVITGNIWIAIGAGLFAGIATVAAAQGDTL